MSKINVPVQKLSIGLYISMPSGYIAHPFMFNSFAIKDEQQIHIIKKMGIAEIEVNLDKSKPEAVKRINEVKIDSDPSAPRYVKPKEEKIPLTLEQSCKKSLIKAEQLYSRYLSIIQEAFSLAILDPEKSIGMVDLLIGELQVQLADTNEAKLCLVLGECAGERVYKNALNTLVMILLLCKEFKLDLKQQNLIAQSAAFHNFGELYVPESIRLNTGALSKPELNFFKQHPLYGQNKLKETNVFSLSIINIIAAHHERLDGSGYPKKLRGAQLNLPMQMLTMVDAFEEIINNRDSSKRVSGNVAAIFLVKNAGSKFNAKLVDAFVKITGIYPPGTLIKWDEQYGVVIFSNKGEIKKPIVKLHTPLDPEAKIKYVDLSQVDGAEIECVKSDDFPEESVRALNITATNFCMSALVY